MRRQRSVAVFDLACLFCARFTVFRVPIQDEIMSLVCERLGSTESKLLSSIDDHNSLSVSVQ